ncbi:SDR family NAD(P)-dependent oxidoreductase, partial [Bradyrhizobium sp.]|uniref:SDR family NAD(P)-dependent oxidoreductase n=1 Tax=Bradyrhizobium sp. TaxID=376 RepID=UPI001EC14FA9
MIDLFGQIAIVTGGSRGVGAATASALASAGASLMLVARDGATASRVAGAIANKGAKAYGVACDVTDYASVEAMSNETNRRLGYPNIVVNNAGIIEPIAFLAESDPAAWRRNIEVNLIGAYNVLRATVPHMIERRGGTVVNVSSSAAHSPLDGWSAYCCAKSGLSMLTKAVMLETAAFGIRVFGFSPGMIDTDMQVQIRASGVNSQSQIPRANL